MLKTKYAHVYVNPNGIPVVGTSQVPLAQIALEVVMLGFSPQELQLFLHPHLTLGEIYAALGFFFDKYFDEHPTVKDRIEHLRVKAMLDEEKSATLKI